ncbi:hypothetical protein [Algicola sagamiensis]|uniref:hypothetical protein n=1 Tax=Algicola sagamiensis TaxID=163869 RepID=UPI00036ABEB5|nr:hypothetical protein [Algicola sagamiensis]
MFFLSNSALAVYCPSFEKSETAIVSNWVIKLNCRGWSTGCYAASSNSYGALEAAKRFSSQSEAQEFIDSKQYRMRQPLKGIEQVTEKVEFCRKR